MERDRGGAKARPLELVCNKQGGHEFDVEAGEGR